MLKNLDLYEYDVTEAMDFLDFNYMYDHLIKKLNFEKSDNLILVTSKIQVPEQYWMQPAIGEETIISIAKEISEVIIKQINARMNRQEKPFTDMAVLRLSYYGYKNGNYAYDTIHFYDIINIKNLNINDIKQKVGYKPLGKKDNFKIAYEAAYGEKNGYQKPFKNTVYIEQPDDSELLFGNFLDLYQNKYYHDDEKECLFGCYKLNTIRDDSCVFKAKLKDIEKIENLNWIKSKAELEKAVELKKERKEAEKEYTFDELFDL